MVESADIAPIIREETVRVETLLAVLDEELAALAHRDAERLGAITTEKHRLVQELETLAKQRRQLVGPVTPDKELGGPPATPFAPPRLEASHHPGGPGQAQQSQKRNGHRRGQPIHPPGGGCAVRPAPVRHGL